MAKKEVGITLAIGGEKEYTQGFSNAVKATKMLQAETKSLAQEFEGSAKARLCPECKKKHHEAAVALQNARRNEQSFVKCEWCGRVFARKKNEKKCEACRKEGRYGSPQMVAHSKRKPPKVSINGVLKIADKDGTTYGKAVLAHNI